ncbi:hypothetical protein EMPG_11193 [Blastomyces silverae]|uniref:Uncharacterized protein n=1 Tax=Blastomyces silverae TaxID=2060906 RepID=A0A0H1B7Y6_9EURO|nr:hypothetical protein EMPG_11193 [Blastomyces silverae]
MRCHSYPGASIMLLNTLGRIMQNRPYSFLAPRVSSSMCSRTLAAKRILQTLELLLPASIVPGLVVKYLVLSLNRSSALQSLSKCARPRDGAQRSWTFCQACPNRATVEGLLNLLAIDWGISSLQRPTKPFVAYCRTSRPTHQFKTFKSARKRFPKRFLRLSAPKSSPRPRMRT